MRLKATDRLSFQLSPKVCQLTSVLLSEGRYEDANLECFFFSSCTPEL